jgi:hypothetical protein
MKKNELQIINTTVKTNKYDSNAGEIILSLSNGCYISIEYIDPR